MSIVRTSACRRSCFVHRERAERRAHPDPFIEFQLFERTILYFPSSPIISLYEKQAASERAPAGMSGIFGWRVVRGETVVHTVPGFRDGAHAFSIESANLLGVASTIFLSSKIGITRERSSRHEKLSRSYERQSLGPTGTDNTMPISYTRS